MILSALPWLASLGCVPADPAVPPMAPEPVPMALTERATESAPSPFGCEARDPRLDMAAQWIIQWRITHDLPVDTPAIDHALRLAGSPHVWPMAWTSIQPTAAENVPPVDKFRQFYATLKPSGEIRCGASSFKDGRGSITWIVVVVDALADATLPPLSAHCPRELSLRGTFLRSARDVALVVTGPDGIPRNHSATLRGREVVAGAWCDRPGPYRMQLVADVGAGPRPILETVIYADVPVPVEPPVASSVPPSMQVLQDDRATLLAWVNTFRVEHGLARLSLHDALTRAADEHSTHMRDRQQLAHELEGRTLETRMKKTGLRSRVVGENVAHAPTLEQAHRSLMDSPSHRANLLRPEFRHMGPGIIRDDNGYVWVTEMFAAELR